MKGAILLSVLVLLFGLSIASSSPAVQCLDNDGNPVDWWVIIKIPEYSSDTDPIADSGWSYAYADVNNQFLEYTSQYINSSDSAAGRTINQIYNGDPSTVGYVIYNDEDPISGNSHSSYGHTKGVCAFDESIGFWLIHSVPKWPEPYPQSEYTYPEGETKYGQHMFCHTLDLATFDSIAYQFLLNKPYVYSANLTSYQEDALPTMVQVIDKDFITDIAQSNVINYKSVGGLAITSFAKNAELNVTLYEVVVEPVLNTGLLLETWQNGSGGKMPSFCTPEYDYNSENIQELTLTSEISWTSTKDHSKWGISTDTNSYLCLGDINRMYSQDARGGGTECMLNPTMWNVFSSLISEADFCDD